MVKENDMRIILQDKGISATHPIIIKKNVDRVIVCSVADIKKKLNKKFNYTIIFDIKGFPFNKGKEEILNYLIHKKFHLESERGHELALKNGLSKELLEEVKKIAKKYV